MESEEQKEIAKTGVDEFFALITYVLTFIPEIYTVEIVDNIQSIITKFQKQPDLMYGFKIITKTQNGKPSIVRLLYASNGNVSIPARIVKKAESFEVSDLIDIPKLFCDFPLIGTETSISL